MEVFTTEIWIPWFEALVQVSLVLAIVVGASKALVSLLKAIPVLVLAVKVFVAVDRAAGILVAGALSAAMSVAAVVVN